MATPFSVARAVWIAVICDIEVVAFKGSYVLLHFYLMTRCFAFVRACVPERPLGSHKKASPRPAFLIHHACHRKNRRRHSFAIFASPRRRCGVQSISILRGLGRARCLATTPIQRHKPQQGPTQYPHTATRQASSYCAIIKTASTSSRG